MTTTAVGTSDPADISPDIRGVFFLDPGLTVRPNRIEAGGSGVKMMLAISHSG